MQNKQKAAFLQSKIISQTDAYKGKWLSMKYVTYSVGDRVNQNYECIYRSTKKNQCRSDGVEIIPIIKYKEKEPEVVVIANFRPPAGGFCIQFPSGLVDNDNYEEEMKRELLEQTGYVLNKTINIPLPTLYIDPWKSNETSIMFMGIIDGDDPGHLQKPTLQAAQNIRVFKFPLNSQLPKVLKEFAEKENYLIEGKLWAIVTGLILHSVLNK